jgi:hypothetical protein
MRDQPLESSEQYRVALFAPGGQAILALREFDSFRLPRVKVAEFARTAQQITTAVRQMYQLDSIVLDFLNETATKEPCAVAEICIEIGDISGNGLTLIDPSRICHADLSDGERVDLLAIVEGKHCSRAPLSCVGWLTQAKCWIRRNAGTRRLDFTGRLTQLNGGGSFCLLRLETKSGPALWLKAVGEPNLHEYDTTMYLASVQPEFLPTILCSRADWHAWVMEEVGTDLEGAANFATCARAVGALAEFQTSMLGRVERMISWNCADHRATVLLMHLDDVFAFVREAMALQAGGRTPPLQPTQVMKLKEAICLALTIFEKMSIPETVAHNDMSLSNILCDEERCVFIDWCEAYIGSPFNAFELFRVILNRHHPSSVDWTAELRAIYLARWIDHLDEARAKALVALTPVLTIYSLLYSRGLGWIDANRHNPLFQRRTRILARHLERARRDPEFVRLVQR